MNGELFPGEFEAMEHNGRMDACMSREAIESMNRWNDYVNGKEVEPMTIAEPCSDVGLLNQSLEDAIDCS